MGDDGIMGFEGMKDRIRTFYFVVLTVARVPRVTIITAASSCHPSPTLHIKHPTPYI